MDYFCLWIFFSLLSLLFVKKEKKIISGRYMYIWISLKMILVHIKNVLDSWKYKLKTGWFDYEEM